VLMKEVERALLKAVGQRIAASGFESRPVGQSFLRRSPLGRDSLHRSFVKHPCDFDVVADVAVRIDDLEDIVNVNDTLLSKKEKEQTYSLGAELGNISGQGQQRWNLASSADVTPVADRITASFNSIGLPYLDEASTIEGAYRLLTSPGRAAWLHSPIHVAAFGQSQIGHVDFRNRRRLRGRLRSRSPRGRYLFAYWNVPRP